jgi:hypothetical protein
MYSKRCTCSKPVISIPITIWLYIHPLRIESRCDFEVAKRYLPVDLEWAEAIATAMTIIAGISSK